MKTSESIADLAAAMCKAQGAMNPALKDSRNDHFKSKYADLTAVWDACRGPLTSNGLTVWQDVEAVADGIAVTTRVVHTSGQWVEFGPLVIPLAKRDAHGVGSAISYAKRYALSAAIGVVSDDDDGNAASHGNGAQNGRAAYPSPAPPPDEDRAPAPETPDGYQAWWDDMVAVAEEGTVALAKAFNASPIEMRRHLTQSHGMTWDALKKKAAGTKAAVAR